MLCPKKKSAFIFFHFKVSVSVSLSATNLNGALLKGVKMLKKQRKQRKLPVRSSDMIILLTDGMPNYGERVRGTEKIQDYKMIHLY